ncbi:hypothetical protein F5B19DRAFT_504474 [Rostrohypoxylon terebratum]|nr:hypothetical protein F5B19DRAFT_504474 [Rostrohypoxylon terebratum]
MATHKSFLCANCGAKVLTDLHTCMRCYYAPKYKDSESMDVYCDKICQQGHLTSHKAQCQLRINRRNLFRAATLMKATFMTFRECLYGRPLVEVKVYKGELHLHMDSGIKFKPWYYPFPDGVTTDPKHKEAALSLQNCNAAANICGGLAKRLLEGTATKMELVCVDANPRMEARILFRHSDPDKPAKKYPLHSVVVVYIKEEKWIIDMTGSQFGFTNLVCPFDEYLRDLEGHVATGPHAYPVDELDDIERRHFPQIDPAAEKTDDFFAHRAHEVAGRRHLKELVEKRFYNLENPNFAADLLARTDKAFQDGLREWTAEVKRHMMGFVQRMTGVFHPDEQE